MGTPKFSPDLKNYRHENHDKLDVWTTSLNLERKHREFIERENLNLSKLVRDFLNSVMASRYSGSDDPK